MREYQAILMPTRINNALTLSQTINVTYIIRGGIMLRENDFFLGGEVLVRRSDYLGGTGTCE